MLTEESGFAGGMMWTGNNIAETHLKSIVNFDYDDTTSFLKTRNPFIKEETVSALDALETMRLNVSKGNTLLGAYNICAHDIKEDVLKPAGWLYLFGSSSTRDSDGIAASSSDNFQLFYQTSDARWFEVEFDPTYQITKADDTVETVTHHTDLCSLNKVQPVLYDNVLYCTNLDNAQIFSAFRLIFINTASEDEDAALVKYHKYVLEPQLYSKNSLSTYTDIKAIKPNYLRGLEYNWDYIEERANSVTLLEAASTGFNGAKGADTFVYRSTAATSTDSPKYIEGVYLTDLDGNIVISPRLGQAVKLHVILSGVPSSDVGYINMYELKQNGDSSENTAWTFKQSYAVSVADTSFEYIFSNDNTTFAFVWSKDQADKDTVVTNPDAYASLMPVTWVANQTSINSRLKAYNLQTSKAYCLWNNHLILWGVENNGNALFISEVDNFYYFPVPHNVALFETNIISCIPYLGSLLVFTADRIYRLSENQDGSFTQEVVQNDMPLTKADAPYLRAIKNMVFFKSGKYFYMVVPKTQSLTGELTIAPIYKNISGFLNDIQTSALNVLQMVYPENKYEQCTPTEYPIDIYVEQDTVHILYELSCKYRTTKEGVLTDSLNQCFTLFLNYNTNLRAWTLYLEDTTEYSLYPAALTTARNMSFVRVAQSGAMLYTAQMLHSVDTANTFRCAIDTGYRTLSNAIKKRFREVQFKLYSETENITTFGTAFYVDGVVRRNYTKLEEAFVDENKRVVTLSPVYDPNTFLTEDTLPLTDCGELVTDNFKQGTDSIELSDWTLDFSHFKRNAPITVRVPVSGKGYSPRFIILAQEGMALCINEINWVYRLMYGR